MAEAAAALRSYLARPRAGTLRPPGSARASVPGPLPRGLLPPPRPTRLNPYDATVVSGRESRSRCTASLENPSRSPRPVLLDPESSPAVISEKGKATQEGPVIQIQLSEGSQSGTRVDLESGSGHLWERRILPSQGTACQVLN